MNTASSAQGFPATSPAPAGFVPRPVLFCTIRFVVATKWIMAMNVQPIPAASIFHMKASVIAEISAVPPDNRASYVERRRVLLMCVYRKARCVNGAWFPTRLMTAT
jgi:hypothetical protein